MVDKNLFLHDLAFVAILKCEGPYLKEWLDYHLLAGVNHFYLYDNGSPDNQAEVAAPYVEAGLADYFYAPGKMMQMAVYDDAVKRFKFHCRYMAFIDGDEFVYPKVDTGGGIVEVVDEIFPHDENAASLVMNWQTFGSNGQETADYSRGVLERFTRRGNKEQEMNMLVKSIANPRRIRFIQTSLHPNSFIGTYKINENGKIVLGPHNNPVTAEKIAVNHYHYMSPEEYAKRAIRGEADKPDGSKYKMEFLGHDYNEIFDDSILTYRANREKIFDLETDEQRIARVTDALAKNLSLFASDTPPQSPLDTALTCRALSTYLRKRFPNDADTWKLCEEASLAAILQSLRELSFVDAQLFISALPEILRLPYPAVDGIRNAAFQIISQMLKAFRLNDMWKDYADLDYIQDLLKAEKV